MFLFVRYVWAFPFCHLYMLLRTFCFKCPLQLSLKNFIFFIFCYLVKTKVKYSSSVYKLSIYMSNHDHRLLKRTIIYALEINTICHIDKRIWQVEMIINPDWLKQILVKISMTQDFSPLQPYTTWFYVVPFSMNFRSMVNYIRIELRNRNFGMCSIAWIAKIILIIGNIIFLILGMDINNVGPIFQFVTELLENI